MFDFGNYRILIAVSGSVAITALLVFAAKKAKRRIAVLPFCVAFCAVAACIWIATMLLPVENYTRGFGSVEAAFSYINPTASMLARIDGEDSALVYCQAENMSYSDIIIKDGEKWRARLWGTSGTPVYTENGIICLMYHAGESNDYYLDVGIPRANGVRSVRGSDGAAFETVVYSVDNGAEWSTYLSKIEYTAGPYYLIIDGEKTDIFYLE